MIPSKCCFKLASSNPQAVGVNVFAKHLSTRQRLGYGVVEWEGDSHGQWLPHRGQLLGYGGQSVNADAVVQLRLRVCGCVMLAASLCTTPRYKHNWLGYQPRLNAPFSFERVWNFGLVSAQITLVCGMPGAHLTGCQHPSTSTTRLASTPATSTPSPLPLFNHNCARL